jgi:transposase InsO family protein
MDERARFAIEATEGFRSISELCRRYNISRPTGYKWLRRYEAEGLPSLVDASHRPRACPHATPPYVTDRIAELRKRRGWGAPKIAQLIKNEFGWAPCINTVHRVLRRQGLVPPQKRRRRQLPPAPPISPMDSPNAVWSADFKGHFHTSDGRVCYPLTIQDGYSRFLLDCWGLPKLSLPATQARFERLFKTYGMPLRIRTDNGHPFASRALGRLSSLSIWFIKLGIYPEFIAPGKPQQNGRHERFHRTLKDRTIKPPARDLRAQQRRFNTFREIYNEERPHQSLGQQTPASLFQHSPRPFPEQRPEIAYPGHLELRQVSQMGTIKWKGKVVCVGHVFARELVGLEETGEGLWSVYYGPVSLGWLDESDFRIMDVQGRSRR